MAHAATPEPPARALTLADGVDNPPSGRAREQPKRFGRAISIGHDRLSESTNEA